MDNFKEEDMYAPIKKFFEKQGYVVRGEVKGCDIALVRGEELAVVELKKSFNMSLLYQAIDRQKIAGMVFIAIPAKVLAKKRGHILHILEKMGIGLLTVTMHTKRRIVEGHLLPNCKSRNNQRTKALLAEFNGRTFDANIGGMTGRKHMTANRERNLHIICALEDAGESSAANLVKKYNCCAFTWRLLTADYYNWYIKIKKGVFALSEKGKQALNDPQYKEFVKHYRKAVRACITAENQGS